MIKRTHRAFATTFTSGALVGYNLLSKSTPVELPLGVHSPTLQPVSLLTLGIAIVVSWLAAALPDMDNYVPIFKHRGITHTIWVVGLLSLGTYYLASNIYLFSIALGFTLGYFSHLLADAYSIAGVAWLYPFTRYIHYESGAMIVRRPRIFFWKLYRVDKKVGPLDAKYYYYTLTIIILVVYLSHIITL